MFVYCANNPVNNLDSCGTAYSPIGFGIQFEVEYNYTVIGVEVLFLWDIEECKDGKPVVAFYVYDGASANVLDALQASILTYVADNTDIFENGSVNPLVCADGVISMLHEDYSISASGFLVFGNEGFKDTSSYCKEFTSVGGSVGKWKAGIAYSSSCYTVSIGRTILGGNLLPSWSVSKTWYERVAVFGARDNATTTSNHNRKGGRSLCAMLS